MEQILDRTSRNILKTFTKLKNQTLTFIPT